MTIRPFKKGSIWAFSEPCMNIFEKPFVGGINDMIDAMLQRADLPTSEPFTALFSSSPFPGYRMRLDLQGYEHGGHWYADLSGVDVNTPFIAAPEGDYAMGWLCPVLCKFFETAPKNIYVRAEP